MPNVVFVPLDDGKEILDIFLSKLFDPFHAIFSNGIDSGGFMMIFRLSRMLEKNGVPTGS